MLDVRFPPSFISSSIIFPTPLQQLVTDVSVREFSILDFNWRKTPFYQKLAQSVSESYEGKTKITVCYIFLKNFLIMFWFVCEAEIIVVEL